MTIKMVGPKYENYMKFIFDGFKGKRAII